MSSPPGRSTGSSPSDPDRALALAEARFAAAVDGHEAERLYALGLLALCFGCPSLAVDRLARALESGESPWRLKTALVLGMALRRAGRLAEAEDALGALVELRPDLLEPSIQLGLVLLDAERPRDALAVHRAALERHAGHPQIVRLLADGAVALDRLDRREEGAAWCEAGLALASHPSLLLNLAAFRLKLGQASAARAALEEACRRGARAKAAAMWRDWGDGSALEADGA